MFFHVCWCQMFPFEKAIWQTLNIVTLKLLMHFFGACSQFQVKSLQPRLGKSVLSKLQHLNQTHGHLCPGGGVVLLRASLMLDLHHVLWLKVLWPGDPGREGSGKQHPLKDIQRQVRSGARRAVPPGGVLKLPAGAVPPNGDAVTEVRFCEGFLWLEACEDAPWFEGWLRKGVPVLFNAFRLLLLTVGLCMLWHTVALIC